jgi:ribosomal protein S18 acetylase RimI-like enzyme
MLRRPRAEERDMTSAAVTPEIRLLDEHEVATVVDWAAAEGWNPGLRDAEAFLAADHGGFLGAFIGGGLAGAVSAVRYGGGFGFIGLFIVRPEYRRYLIGVRLGRAALELLDGRCIGTDGVPAQQHQYERLGGFETAWRNVRYRGRLDTDCDGGAADPVVPASAVPLGTLAAYDAVHFGARRDAFLRSWITLPDHEALVWAEPDPAGSPTEVRGFGAIRRCREGRKIGPLFADDPGIAEALFLRLTSGRGDVTLDTPEANPAAVALAERYGMSPVLETARMYRGGDPGLPAPRVFGITSFELG